MGTVRSLEISKAVSSFIFRIDSENGKAKFTVVTHELAPELKDIGMLCDTLFTDFDNDGQSDLILTGEWMPVTFFKNVSKGSGVNDKAGW